jgi:hypothetical protein
MQVIIIITIYYHNIITIHYHKNYIIIGRWTGKWAGRQSSRRTEPRAYGQATCRQEGMQTTQAGRKGPSTNT